MKVAKMQEQFSSHPDAAGWLAVALGWLGAALMKVLPAGLGAAIVVLVDPPETKRDLFARFFCAFVASVFLGEFALDLLRANIGWLSFLDPTKRTHMAAIDFIMGAVGWFLFGGAVMWLKRLRLDPAAAAEEARRIAP